MKQEVVFKAEDALHVFVENVKHNKDKVFATIIRGIPHRILKIGGVFMCFNDNVAPPSKEFKCIKDVFNCYECGYIFDTIIEYQMWCASWLLTNIREIKIGNRLYYVESLSTFDDNRVYNARVDNEDTDDVEYDQEFWSEEDASRDLCYYIVKTTNISWSELCKYLIDEHLKNN